ncbi:MAG: 30S ribosome-binding factor RbfA [Pseudomonadota bacterium]|nr:30S ribosome-binding factor RbfA [Pseudomonadota bacterium]
MTRQSSASGPSQRQLRVGEMLRKALSEVFIRVEIADPELAGAVITVTEVRATPDLRQATAFVMPLGGGAGQQQVVDALDRHRRFIRGEVARRVELKYIPDIRFRLDGSFDEADHVDAVLRSARVARDLN